MFFNDAACVMAVDVLIRLIERKFSKILIRKLPLVKGLRLAKNQAGFDDSGIDVFLITY